MYFILIGVDLRIAPSPKYLNGSWLNDFAGSIGPCPGALFLIGVPDPRSGSLLGLTPYRRTLYAVGCNDATAFASGVNVALVRMIAYALGGLFAAVGGIALIALRARPTRASPRPTRCCDRRGRARRHVAVGWARRTARLAARRGLDLPAREPADHAAGRSELPAGHVRRHADLRRRSWGLAGRAKAAGMSARAGGARLRARRRARPWRRLVGLQARFPVLQVVALVVVFAYGAIDLGSGTGTASSRSSCSPRSPGSPRPDRRC